MKTNHQRASMLARGLGVALLTVSATAATDSPPQPDAPQPVKDAWIDGRLETAYALNPYLNPFAIDTDVQTGVVRLSGTLQSDIDRDLAVKIAEGVDGVERVDDQLTVDPNSTSLTDQVEDAGRTFAQWVKDITASARVKTNLLANGNTKGLAINVDTRDDVVTLKGTVGSRKEKMLAEMIARNTDGIHNVVNQLDIDEAA